MTIIILQTLWTKCCKKRVHDAVPEGLKKTVDDAVPKVDVLIRFFRYIWGIASSYTCVVTANKAMCDFFTDTSINKESSVMLNMEMKYSRYVCEVAAGFHNASNTSKTMLDTSSDLYPEHAYAGAANITGAFVIDIPFLFLSGTLLISAMFILVLIVAVILAIRNNVKLGYTIIILARYPYKFMTIVIAVYVIMYTAITSDQVAKNTLSIGSLVLSCISLFVSIVMISLYTYRKCCRKKKNKSSDVESQNVQPSDNIE